jgi:hypothetical protein
MTEVTPRFKAEKVDGERHLARLRLSPCSIPGCYSTDIVPHHERRGTGGGIAKKPPDSAALPLCVWHHGSGHQIGWATFESKHGVDLRMIAEGHATVSRGMGLLPKEDKDV